MVRFCRDYDDPSKSLFLNNLNKKCIFVVARFRPKRFPRRRN